MVSSSDSHLDFIRWWPPWRCNVQARFAFQALLAGMGIQRKTVDVTESMLQDRERFLTAGWIQAEDAPTALAGVTAPVGQRLDGRAQEVAPDFRAWGEHGYVWGRPGHYPLWVMLGPNRIRSADGETERAIRKYKTQRWRAGGSWPWWIYHESEKWYWLAGAESSGRGHTGDPFRARFVAYVPQRCPGRFVERGGPKLSSYPKGETL